MWPFQLTINSPRHLLKVLIFYKIMLCEIVIIRLKMINLVELTLFVIPQACGF